MKSLITLIGTLALIWVAQAQAEDKLLTDRMLEAITAGQLVELQAENVQQTANIATNNLYENNPQNQIDNGNPNALNVVNIPNIIEDNAIDNSQNVNSKNNVLALVGNAQENAHAMNIVNSILSTVGNGVNAHYTGSGGSLNNLYQTNIITNIR